MVSLEQEEAMEANRPRPKYLIISAVPRYQEDAWVNGIEEPEPPAASRMPGLINGVLELWIDLDLCRVAYWPEGTTARTHYKVCDDGAYWLLDEHGSRLDECGPYVPEMVTPGGFGDYLGLSIGSDGRVYEYKNIGTAEAPKYEPWRPGRFAEGF
jgi:hypothetical protein